MLVPIAMNVKRKNRAFQTREAVRAPNVTSI
jgi:hypothetical protein